MLTATKMKLAAVTAFGIGIIACSSSSSPANGEPDHDGGTSNIDGGGGGGSMTLSDFCTGLLTALSNVESKCEGGSAADWEAENDSADNDTCAALASAATAGRVKFDGSQASACIAAYNAITCESLTSGATEPAACLAALSGTVAKGGACYSDDDCAGTSSHCNIVSTGTPQSCTGKCEDLLAAGATCSATNSSCIDGYECLAKTGSTTEVCTAIPATKTAAKGAACGFDSKTTVTTACDAGLVCDPTTMKCISQVAVGGSCAAASYACEPFTYCDASMKCSAGAASGAACGVVSTTDVQCAAGLTCKQADGATTGTCGTLAGSGAACTGDQDCLSSGCGTDKKCTAACTEI